MRANAPMFNEPKRRVDTEWRRIFLFSKQEIFMNSIVYIVGAIVIVIAILSFLGMR